MNRYLLGVLLWSTIIPVFGQHNEPGEKDPQNIKIEPQYTDCHQMPNSFAQLSEALAAIDNTKFYLDESIRTTRKSGLMQARYVSCDFKTGYLLVRYDGIDQLYPGVEVELWQQFQGTSDIDGFYFQKIQKLPKIDQP
jgi:hypothetical protein